MDLSQLYCFMNMTKIQTLIFLIFNIFDKKNIREEREKAWFMVAVWPKINSSFDFK